MRQDAARSDKAGELEKSYKGLLSEKRYYKFRNYKHAKPGTVFFPGCNLPSLYPKTVKKLVSMLVLNMGKKVKWGFLVLQ